jgi:hypothetical protein
MVPWLTQDDQQAQDDEDDPRPPIISPATGRSIMAMQVSAIGHIGDLLTHDPCVRGGDQQYARNGDSADFYDSPETAGPPLGRFAAPLTWIPLLWQFRPSSRDWGFCAVNPARCGAWGFKVGGAGLKRLVLSPAALRLLAPRFQRRHEHRSAVPQRKGPARGDRGA